MLKYLKDHFIVHHGLWSYINLKDKCSILCRFACSLLSSCFFSFVCDLADVACCRLRCDCQPHLTHWNINASVAPHMVIQSRNLLNQKILKVRWPEKRKSDFVLSALGYFGCVLGIFFNEFLFPVNIHKLHNGEYTLFCAGVHVSVKCKCSPAFCVGGDPALDDWVTRFKRGEGT